MGVTYKAFDLETQRPVAIKQLHLSRMQEWKTLEMFEREAHILQQLSHPRIPKYLEYCSIDSAGGTQFLLVQEYVEGKTLKQLIEEGWRGTEADMLDIFIDLLDILVYLHSLRPPVIHRDVNPKNIIISPNLHVAPAMNDVYLVDFGAVQDRIRTTVLAGTTVVGTYGYVPFEQFSGQAVPASDYYALGATLLFMLTHRHPWEFQTEEMKPQFEPFLKNSPGLAQLLNGLLEPSVKKRIASPEQIKDIFAQYIPSSWWHPSDTKKPDDTKIEKIANTPGRLSFRIPNQKIGMALKHIVLHLTPEWLFAHEELLGFHSGELWRIPTPDVESSDLTWYFGKRSGASGQSVLGINHAGETHEIGVHLSKAEIQWLSHEIQEYLWDAQSQPLPLKSDVASEGRDGKSAQKTHEKPLGSPIKKSLKGHNQLRFRIPKMLPPAEVFDTILTSLVCLAIASVLTGLSFYLMYQQREQGWLSASAMLSASSVFWGLGLAWLVLLVSRIFGCTALHLAPDWIKISRRWFGFIGFSRHIPTASVSQYDVIRYFHKQTLLLGINYAQKTVPVASGVTPGESEWLIREITDYIVRFAKPIPQAAFEGDLEMK